jgi:hypothetical protein
MTDYKSKVHNIYLTANFAATADLRMFGTVAFNKARASLDEVLMPDVENRLEGDLEDQDFTFEEMASYSDLDFELINVHLGFEYSLTPEVLWTTEGIFGSLWDYAPYVFEDESGSLLFVRSGVKIDF